MMMLVVSESPAQNARPTGALWHGSAVLLLVDWALMMANELVRRTRTSFILD